MKLKEICGNLGISGMEFVEITGYTRQALSLFDLSNMKVAKTRWKSSMKALENYIILRKQSEIQQINERYEKALNQINLLLSAIETEGEGNESV